MKRTGLHLLLIAALAFTGCAAPAADPGWLSDIRESVYEIADTGFPGPQGGAGGGGATDTTGLTDLTLVGGSANDTMRIAAGVLTPNGTLTISDDSNVTIEGGGTLVIESSTGVRTTVTTSAADITVTNPSGNITVDAADSGEAVILSVGGAPVATASAGNLAANESLSVVNLATLGTAGLQLDITADDPGYAEGRVWYDPSENALAVYNDEAEVTLQVGQEMWIRVRNTTGSTIRNGAPVYISGSSGNLPEVALAQADSVATANVIGVATHDIENNSNGYITSAGHVHDLRTSPFSVGDILYLGAASAGTLTASEPSVPDLSIIVGVVLIDSPAVGVIQVQFDGMTQSLDAVTRAGATANVDVTVNGTLTATQVTVGTTLITATDINNTGGGAGSAVFGAGATNGGTGNSIYGPGASAAAANSVAMGGGGATVTGNFGTSVGWATSSANGTSIGNGATSTGDGHASGSGATAGSGGTAVGPDTTASGAGSLAAGDQSTTGAWTYSIAMGYQAAATAANQLTIGRSGGGITEAYIGQGVSSATATGLLFSSTGGLGSEKQGGTLTFQSGLSTGTKPVSAIQFQVGDGQDNGASVQQTAAVEMSIDENGVTVSDLTNSASAGWVEVTLDTKPNTAASPSITLGVPLCAGGTLEIVDQSSGGEWSLETSTDGSCMGTLTYNGAATRVVSNSIGVSMDVGSGTQDLWPSLFQNGVELLNTKAMRAVQAGGDTGRMAVRGTAEMATGDTLNLRWDINGTTVTVTYLTWFIQDVGKP